MELLMVGIGGFFGAIARYLVYLIERSMGAGVFPFGTLCINIFGCLLAGFLLAKVERGDSMHRYFLLLCSMGFIGSFTTFSTFSVETFQLIRSNQILLALLNLGMNCFLGIGAVWFGRMLMMRF